MCANILKCHIQTSYIYINYECDILLVSAILTQCTSVEYQLLSIYLKTTTTKQTSGVSQITYFCTILDHY